MQPLWPGEGNADVNTAKHWQPREPKGRPYERQARSVLSDLPVPWLSKADPGQGPLAVP